MADQTLNLFITPGYTSPLAVFCILYFYLSIHEGSLYKLWLLNPLNSIGYRHFTLSLSAAALSVVSL